MIRASHFLTGNMVGACQRFAEMLQKHLIKSQPLRLIIRISHIVIFSFILINRALPVCVCVCVCFERAVFWYSVFCCTWKRLSSMSMCISVEELCEAHEEMLLRRTTFSFCQVDFGSNVYLLFHSMGCTEGKILDWL